MRVHNKCPNTKNLTMILELELNLTTFSVMISMSTLKKKKLKIPKIVYKRLLKTRKWLKIKRLKF